MPSDTPNSIFIEDVMDIEKQLMRLGEHWKSLLEADTKLAFQGGLYRFHHSTEVMQVCVSGSLPTSPTFVNPRTAARTTRRR